MKYKKLTRLLPVFLAGLGILTILILTGTRLIQARAASFDCTPVTEIPQADCNALVAIYNSTGGTSWTNNTNWLTTNTPCSSPWFGVECENGMVSDLLLGSNNLVGTIPSQIGDFTGIFSIVLHDNQLSGSIPTTIGNLSTLDFLSLSTNQLTGTIPDEIGNLSSLTGLWLDTNQLQGSIPTSISGLTSISSLLLFDNQLSGSLPTELTNLTTLTDLEINGNQFTGPLPSGLGTLSNLLILKLNDNAFSGDVPPSFSGLSNTFVVDLGYNMLTASDPGVITWLGTHDPDWASTQTVPPSGVSTGAVSNTTIDLSWTPITYTADGGYYQVEFSTSPGGPFAIHGTTSDKTASGYTATGLASGTTYFFQVRTFTPMHSEQKNDLLSAPSAVVSATTSGNPPTATPTPTASATPTATPTATPGASPTPTATSPPPDDFFNYLPVIRRE